MTIQQEIENAVMNGTKKSIDDLADDFARQIIHSNPTFWRVENKPADNGNWKWEARITFADPVVFGEYLSWQLTKNTCHRNNDENLDFDIENFFYDIVEICEDYIKFCMERKEAK